VALTKPMADRTFVLPSHGQRPWRVRIAAALVGLMTIGMLGVGAVTTAAAAEGELSSDATLSSLTVSAASKPVALFPAFVPTWDSYTVSLPATQLTFSCAFTTSDSRATVTPPGCEKVTFKKGVYATQVVTFAVTAADGQTKNTYTLTVVHNSVVNVKALLKSVSIKGVALTPKFNAKTVQTYQAKALPGTKTVIITAAGLGKVKATLIKPKVWAARGLNFIRVKTALGKLVGDYTLVVMVPAYPKLTSSNITDIPAGFTADFQAVNGFVDTEAATATLDPKQPAVCAESDPVLAWISRSASNATAFVSSVVPGCKVTLQVPSKPAFGYLPATSGSTVKRTVPKQISWSVDEPVSTLDGFTATFTVGNAKVKCTVEGSQTNFCTFPAVADEDGMRSGELRLTGRGLGSEATVTVSFIPDANTAARAAETVSGQTLKGTGKATVGSAVTRAGGFSVPIKLDPGSTVAATIDLKNPSQTCEDKSLPRLRTAASSSQLPSAILMSDETVVDAVIYATGVFKGCEATITFAISGNTGYASPTGDAATKTVTGTGGDAVATFAYTVERTTDGFIATYETFGGTVAGCPQLVDSKVANRISVSCDIDARTVTVTGALPAETVSLDVPFATADDFTAPEKATLVITGQAKFGPAKVTLVSDSLRPLAEGFRFRVKASNCTPSAQIVDTNVTVSEPQVTVASDLVTVSDMKLDYGDPGADRTASVQVDCAPDAGYEPAEPIYVPGMTAPFGGVFAVNDPRLEPDPDEEGNVLGYGRVAQFVTLISSEADWVFPPTSTLTLTYSWERSVAADGTTGCEQYETIDGAVEDLYLIQLADQDRCIRAVVTPSLKNKDGSITNGDPIATGAIPVAMKPAYNMAEPLPEISVGDAGLLVGGSLSVTSGSWLRGQAGASFTYQWQRCEAPGSADSGAAQDGVNYPAIIADCGDSWVDIDIEANPTAATSMLYLSELEIGAYVRAVVTLTNPVDAASVYAAAIAVPATAESLANAVAETPESLNAPQITAIGGAAAPNLPLAVTTAATWRHAAGLRADWLWQYRANAGSAWVNLDPYVDVDGKEIHAITMPNLVGEYRVVEFLVDPDDAPVFGTDGNQIQVFSDIINVTND